MVGLMKFFNKFYIVPVSKFANTTILTAVRNSFIMTIPLVMTASAAILFNNFPITFYQNAMLGLFGPNWQNWGNYAHSGALAAISPVIAFAIGYNLTLEHNIRTDSKKISPKITAIISLCSVAVVLLPSGLEQNTNILQWLGLHGLFVSTVLSLIAAIAFIKLSCIFGGYSAFFNDEADFEISNAMAALLPAFIVIAGFAVSRIALSIAGIENLYQFTYELIIYPFNHINNAYKSSALYIFLVQLFWCFGIHGGHVLEPVAGTFYQQAIIENASAAQLGQPALNLFTSSYFNSFVFIGGSGATLSLMLAIFLFSNRGSSRKIAKISLLPSIFNINELLVFGLPVVMNPFFIIPFILCPLILGGITYIITTLGFMPYTVVAMTWTTPPIINAYIATGGSLNAVFVQVINICIGIFIYAPFVLAYDHNKVEAFRSTYKRMLHTADEHNEAHSRNHILSREDDIGAAARSLSADLQTAFTNNELFIEYQPQLNIKANSVFSVETVLRWHHPTYGIIPHSLIIALSQDSGNMCRLGLWIIEQGIKQLTAWKKLGINDINVTANLCIAQLNNDTFVPKIREMLEVNGLPHSSLCIGISEITPLKQINIINDNLRALRDTGIRIAVQNAFIGYAPQFYLRQFPVNILKINLEPGVTMTDNPADLSMLEPIITICKVLNIEIVVNGISTEHQADELAAMGIDKMQGDLFAPPTNANEIIRYIQQIHYSGFIYNPKALLN